MSLLTSPLGPSMTKLKSFLGASVDTEADLILPKFEGGKQLAGVEKHTPFIYPGTVYSDRDTRSAFYISNLLGNIIRPDKIYLKDTITYDDKTSSSKLIFVFGSKSNQFTSELFVRAKNKKIFSLDFGDYWTIHSNKSGVNYSLANPAEMSRQEYESSTDFGIIARFLPQDNDGKTIFIIAGLGSRATEGCGIYFVNNWRLINTKFGSNDIAAVVLKFPPPVDPKNHLVQEWINN
ncbi:MAG: hypothetical protein ABI863_10460 [Ginsengibacter sp.]